MSGLWLVFLVLYEYLKSYRMNSIFYTKIRISSCVTTSSKINFTLSKSMVMIQSTFTYKTILHAFNIFKMDTI